MNFLSCTLCCCRSTRQTSPDLGSVQTAPREREPEGVTSFRASPDKAGELTRLYRLAVGGDDDAEKALVAILGDSALRAEAAKAAHLRIKETLAKGGKPELSSVYGLSPVLFLFAKKRSRKIPEAVAEKLLIRKLELEKETISLNQEITVSRSKFLEDPSIKSIDIEISKIDRKINETEQQKLDPEIREKRFDWMAQQMHLEAQRNIELNRLVEGQVLSLKARLRDIDVEQKRIESYLSAILDDRTKGDEPRQRQDRHEIVFSGKGIRTEKATTPVGKDLNNCPEEDLKLEEQERLI